MMTSQQSTQNVGDAPSSVLSNKMRRSMRFGLSELLLLTAAIAVWIPVFVARRRIPPLERDIQIMRRATTDLFVEDETQLTARVLPNILPHLSVWKCRSPLDAKLELRMATEGINSLGLPTGYQSVVLPGGANTIHLKTIKDQHGFHEFVYLDGAVVLEEHHPLEWADTFTSSSKTDVGREAGTFPLDQVLMLVDERYSLRHPYLKNEIAPAAADQDHKGVLLWISPRNLAVQSAPRFVGPSVGWNQPNVGHREGIRIGSSKQKGLVGLITIQPWLQSVFGADLLRQHHSRLAISVRPVVHTGITAEVPETQVNPNDPNAIGNPFRLSSDIASSPLVGGKLVEDELVTKALAGDGEKMRLFAHYQPFSSGAEPIVEIIFDPDHPERVGFLPHAAPGSTPMKACQFVTQFDSCFFWRAVEVAAEVDPNDGSSVGSQTLMTLNQLFPELYTDKNDPALDGGKRVLPWKEIAFAPLPRARLAAELNQIRRLSLVSDVGDWAGLQFPLGLAPRWTYQGITNRQVWWLPIQEVSTATKPDVKVEIRPTEYFPTTSLPLPGGKAIGNVRITVPMPATKPVWFGIVAEPAVRLVK
ncbi:hypothetical protein N9250_01880 [bacterium]|nr:hypothetical protein [bacterium]